MNRNPNIFDAPKFEYDYIKFFRDAQTLNEDEKKRAYRDMCLKDVYFLMRYGAGFPAHVMDMPFAVERCRRINRQIRENGFDKWMRMVFRGGYKSLLFDYAVNLQNLLKDPESSGCIFSFNKKCSVKHMKVIKGILETSEQLKDWFPDILFRDPINEAPLWSDMDGIIVKRQSNRAEPTIMSSGLVSGKPTGMHFNYLCFDDVVTGDTVKTYHSMEETLQEFESACSLVVTLPSATVWRWIIGTYYHYEDPHCKIRDKGTFFIEKIPWKDENGNYYVHSEEAAEFLLKTLSKYEISCQYLLEPVPDDEKRFNTEKISYYEDDINLNGMKMYLLCDPATNKKGSRQHDTDRTAMWVLGKDRSGYEYFIDGIYDRLTRPEAVEKAFDLIKKYNIGTVSWEQSAAQEDEHWIRRMRNEKGVMFKLISFEPKGEKFDRIEGSLMAMIENGLLKFPKKKEYQQADGPRIDLIKVLKQEMREFRHGHDDFLDCGAQRSTLPEYGKPISINSKKDLNYSYEKPNFRNMYL